MNITLALLMIWGRNVAGLMRVWIGPIPFFFATTAEAAEVLDVEIDR